MVQATAKDIWEARWRRDQKFTSLRPCLKVAFSHPHWEPEPDEHASDEDYAA